MSDLHIDDFCRDAAKTLIMLYSKFPQKIIVYVEDFAGTDTPDEYGLHSPRFVAGFHTLLWLAETDYIQYTHTIRQEAIEEATLTHRCFSFLAGPDQPTETLLEPRGSMPQVLPRRVNILRDAVANKSSDHLTALVLRFMRESRLCQ